MLVYKRKQSSSCSILRMKFETHSESDSEESEYEDSINKSIGSSIKSDNSNVHDSSANTNESDPSEYEELGETDDEKSTEAKPPVFDDSSDSKTAQSGCSDDSEVEEDIVPFRRKTAKHVNRIDDSESDEEIIQKRKTLYELEPEGDLSMTVEDNVFSKATRRSIHGFNPKLVKDEPVSEEDDSENSEIIISDSEDENCKSPKVTEKKLSPISIRSPLKDVVKNELVEKEDSFNKSIQSKLSSTISEDNDTYTKKVSRASYDRLVAEKESLASRITSMKKLVEISSGLPDGGTKLRIAIVKCEQEYQEKEDLLKSLIIDENDSAKNSILDSIKSENESSVSGYSPGNISEDDFMAAKDVKPKYTGKVGMKNFEQQKALTVEKLQDIHASLDERPSEDILASPPKHLKVELMRHQLHAIAFMIWREDKKSPHGGILADDMGLGKTLTVISLILKQLQAFEERDDDNDETDTDEGEREEEQQWIARGHKPLKLGGTLVVCPASLINQWEQEIKTKVKRGALDVNVFHGSKRITRARDLAKFDVVITTYQIILSEQKNDGCLFGIKWDRIVLDEGHVIRNYRSKQSEAVCSLIGKKRWVLTGTPVQNKEFDIYAAIKFLRCNPFDDLRYWRTWIEVRGGGSSPRLQALLKSILIRRTKQQLMESGEIQSLPEKHYEQVSVALTREERAVYNRLLALSKQIFAQFLAQHNAKHNNFTYDNENLHKLHQKFAKIMHVDREVQAHEILTLLLRLRQICCHPGLVKSAIESSELDKESIDNELNESNNDSDLDILKKLQNLNIQDKNPNDSQGESPFSQDVKVSLDSEVFNMDIPSSKIEKLMETLRQKLLHTNDKAIIVSQWVSYLNIIKAMLDVECIKYCELNGSVPVKFRNDIVVDFNKESSGIRVMLLSITAGGVGLNLVGANHLYVMDPHWNPQIEQQAQDRIYRFGQKKNVKIIKFICEDTIEEKILKKQEEKLEIAVGTLTGAKRNATKLTIEDLKDIFGMK